MKCQMRVLLSETLAYILFLRYYSLLRHILCSLAITIQPGLLVEAEEKRGKKKYSPDPETALFLW